MNQQQSVTLSVNLALQNAKNQAEALRKILNESVKPDSAAYRELEKLLNKIELQADGFKQSMGEAFKTSSGTRKFTNDIQKLFNSIGIATERFKDLKGKDLILSNEDVQRIDEINKKINETNNKIKELKTGKINGFFADDSVAEFKQVQELAKKLGVDLNDTTFTQFSRKINTELTKVNAEVEESTKKLEDLQWILMNLDLTDINQLSQNLRNNISTDSITGVLTKKGAADARKELNELYKNNADVLGARTVAAGRFTKGQDAVEVFQEENKEISEILQARIDNSKQKVEQLQKVYDQLLYASKSGVDKAEKNKVIDANEEIFKSLGLDRSKAKQPGQAASAVKYFREAIEQELKKEMTELKNNEDTKKNIEQAFSDLLANIDTTKIIGSNDKLKKFREDIVTLLSGKGVDTNNTNIKQALNDISNLDSVDDAIGKVTDGVQKYISTIQQTYDTTQKAQQSQLVYAKSLEETKTTISNANNTQKTETNNLIATQEQLKQLIEQIVAARLQEILSTNELTNAEKQNNDARKQSLDMLQQFNAEQIKSEQRTQNLSNIKSAITNWMGFNQVLNLTRRAVSEAINHIKQLDATMNGIAIVTDMTTADLWKQVDAYSEMAQKFGVTIQGAYEVSKIYYQAGYETNDVLTLTNETLKLAKISGLDYATTTDYMMTA